MDGASALCAALVEQGVEYMFGVVGIPVIEVAVAAQAYGIKYIGMRHESAASYAAGAIGYMTGRPGACLVVSGPGVVHGLAGLANAQANCWPMILIGGASDFAQDGSGAFQEGYQVEWARPYCKFAHKPTSVEQIPILVEKAVRMSINGRPGAVYLDISGSLVNGTSDDDVDIPKRCADPARPLADPSLITSAIHLLSKAARPLVIVGKGAAYSRAELEVRRFVAMTGVPFLATPMGKGTVPDDHHQSVAAARSLALRRADVVLLLGARLNWILHFGKAPRYAEDVKFIQLDISGEEIGTNVPAEVGLVGDAKAIVAQLADEAESQRFLFDPEADWWKELSKKIKLNRAIIGEKMADDSTPLCYERVFSSVKQVLPRDCIIVSEGANTMDIGRGILSNYYPRHRLDAGSFGTMGVGLGFAIAAAIANPDKQIVAVEGDSAFGFSGLEVETACRFKLHNITILVVNNGGIYQGLSDAELPEDMSYAPVTSLTPARFARYEKIAEAFGGKGFFVSLPEELLPTLNAAMSADAVSVVNIAISPTAERKKQEFDWLTRAKL